MTRSNNEIRWCVGNAYPLVYDCWIDDDRIGLTHGEANDWPPPHSKIAREGEEVTDYHFPRRHIPRARFCHLRREIR